MDSKKSASSSQPDNARPRATFLVIAGRLERTGQMVNDIVEAIQERTPVYSVPFGEGGYSTTIDLFVGNQIIDRMVRAEPYEKVLFVSSGATRLRQIRMFADLLPKIMGRDLIDDVVFVYSDDTDPAVLEEVSGSWRVLHCSGTPESVAEVVNTVT
jgi:hypothetical protein